MDTRKRVFTLPNVLSMIRIVMIPIIVWLYLVEKNYAWAGGMLIFSGVTDVVDGFIARRFNMISDLGKVLDPIADKLTQSTMLICLLLRFPMMILPLALMVLKELFMSVTGLLVIRRTGKVMSADWHGKAATVLIYATMIVHIFWYDISPAQSSFLIGATMVMIAISFWLYGKYNMTELKKEKARRAQQETEV